MYKLLAPILLAAWGCAAPGEVLPVVDANGDLVGSYDSVAGTMDLAHAPEDASAVMSGTGLEFPLEHGFASLDEGAEAGDAFDVIDDAGTRLESVWVADADLIDGVSEDYAESRLGGCYNRAH